MSILVVDNGSAPEAVEKLRANLSDVELIVLGANTGFGPGANVGIRRWLDDPARSEWVAVAPHDALPKTGCLERVLAAAQARSRAGLACADVGDASMPVVDPYFGGITRPLGALRIGPPAVDGWIEAGYPHGTLLFARRRCLEEIGLFDERYFAYCEEADLGERARRAGWQVGLVKGADVRNPYLGSAGATVDYLMLRNTLLLVRRHFGRYRVSIRFVMALWQLGAGWVRGGRRSPLFHPRARVRALVDFARGSFGPPPDGLR